MIVESQKYYMHLVIENLYLYWDLKQKTKLKLKTIYGNLLVIIILERLEKFPFINFMVLSIYKFIV